MKLLKTIVLSTALARAPLAAHAEVFNFSYSFDPANTTDSTALAVTGSFSGDLVGSFISNISNISVFLNGQAFTGPLVAEELDSSGNVIAAPVQVSFNMGSNSFAFFNTTDPSTASNFLAIAGGFISAVNTNQAGNNFGFETADGAKWTLATVPVPEPSSYALLLAGLALMTMVARRRTQR